MLVLAAKRLSAIILLAAFAWLPIIGQASAASELLLPWPEKETIDHIGGTRVEFPSHSPFGLSDVGSGPEDDPPTTAMGMLFLPDTASEEAPVPAVVLLHGAAGVLGARELTYARQFAALGIATLVIDVFGARRDRASGFIERLLKITEAMFLADAFAALDFLGERADIDPDRIALIGFSYGGMVATYAAYAQVAEKFAMNGERFAAHVAFYAPCIAEFKDGRATGAPLLMLYGARDAIVDPKRCARVAEQLEAGGGDVETVVYQDAVHQWDGRFNGERHIGRNLADCALVVERDGTVRDRFLLLPMTNAFFRKVILALCADDEGYLIGRNDGIRVRSNHDMGRFLDRAFNGGKAER